MNIESKNYAGVACVLVRQRDGQPVPVGTMLTTFQGKQVRLMGGRAPQNPASTGKVWVQARDSGDATSEYYPSVINCEWAERLATTQGVPP